MLCTPDIEKTGLNRLDSFFTLIMDYIHYYDSYYVKNAHIFQLQQDYIQIENNIDKCKHNYISTDNVAIKLLLYTVLTMSKCYAQCEPW